MKRMFRDSKNHFITPLSVFDLGLVLTFALFSPNLTNLVAPYCGWDCEATPDILRRSPFLSGMAIAFVPLVLHAVGFYHRAGLQRISTALRQLAHFCAYYLCAVAFYQTLRSHSLLFNHVLLVNMVGVPCVIFLRFLLIRLIKLYILRRPGHLRQVILAGTREQVEKGWNKLPDYWKKYMNVVGRFYVGQTDLNEVQRTIQQNAVSHLFVFGGLSAYLPNEQIIHMCELQGIDIYLCRSEHHTLDFTTEVNTVDDVRMIVLTAVPPYTWGRLIKQVCDLLLAPLFILISLPVWIFAAVGIKLSDPKGPIFYRQLRSGLHGKPFFMWKFRSMYSDAEERLTEVKQRCGNEMNGPLFKLTNDPRIFPFGRILRKLSIDELPQLLNVLIGDMSLVGPRPMAVYETDQIPDIAHRRRMSVKPGLTCYWQIEDRSTANDSYTKMIEKDLRYIDHWSLWVDLLILLRTIPAVLIGKGAK